MNTPADDWPNAPLNGVLISAILFLSFLPALGWAWHSVLPEHTHVFLGVAHLDDDEILPASPTPDEPAPCVDCKTPQMSSGVAHIPSSVGLQVLGMAATSGAIFLSFVPTDFLEPVVFPPSLYRSPIVLPLDPPPNSHA
jgi:hypothetical protein